MLFGEQMDSIEKQLQQMGIDLSLKGEYIEQCYVCGGFMLRRYSANKRIACESPTIITAVTDTGTAKTEMRIEGGELKDVYVCQRCEKRLTDGDVVVFE